MSHILFDGLLSKTGMLSKWIEFVVLEIFSAYSITLLSR